MVRQLQFLDDGTITSVPVRAGHKPEYTRQYEMFPIGTPLCPTQFVQQHANDVIPNEIEISQPGFRASFKTNDSKVANEAIKIITR